MKTCDLTLNNLQWLMCHKTKPNQTKPNKNANNTRMAVNNVPIYIYIYTRLAHGFEFHVIRLSIIGNVLSTVAERISLMIDYVKLRL